MIAFAAKLAAALAVTAGIASTAIAAPSTHFAEEPAVAVEQVELAVYCEYVIVWDVWGNAYYEYYCY